MAMPRVAHVQVPSDEGEEMLLEVETLNTAKPRHWYFAGAGLALLVVLGVAAKVLYRSPETSLKTKDINTIQEWEQIPGIDTVVEHAKTLELKQPLRNLNDLLRVSAGRASLDPHRVCHRCDSGSCLPWPGGGLPLQGHQI